MSTQTTRHERLCTHIWKLATMSWQHKSSVYYGAFLASTAIHGFTTDEAEELFDLYLLAAYLHNL